MHALVEVGPVPRATVVLCRWGGFEVGEKRCQFGVRELAEIVRVGVIQMQAECEPSARSRQHHECGTTHLEPPGSPAASASARGGRSRGWRGRRARFEPSVRLRIDDGRNARTPGEDSAARQEDRRTATLQEALELRGVWRRIRRGVVEIACKLESDLLEDLPVASGDRVARALECIERRVQLSGQTSQA